MLTNENVGPSSRSSTFNDKEEIISPTSDVVESDNPVEDFSQPTPTSRQGSSIVVKVILFPYRKSFLT